MHGPVTAGWLLVALCAAAGGYCLLRMRSSVDEQRSSAGGEALMGFGMAAMAVPAAVLAPPRWMWLAYAVVFSGAALHTLVSARGNSHRPHRLRHHLHHLLGTLVMVYMAVAMAAASGETAGTAGAPGATGAHSGMTGTMAGMSVAGGIPLLTGALLIYYAGYVLGTGARLLPGPATAGSTGGGGAALAWGDRPELGLACRLSMGLATLAMLLTL